MQNYGTAALRGVTATNQDRSMSVAEIVDELGVHKTTIYREIKRGNLKAYRIGTGRGTLRVPASSLAEYRETITAAALVEVA